MDVEVAPKVRYEGSRVMIAGREYIIPSLGVKQARDLWPTISEWSKLSPEDLPKYFDGGIQVIHAAMSRNYPDYSIAELEDSLSHKQFQEVLMTVLRESGLAPVTGPQPVPAGSAPAQ